MTMRCGWAAMAAALALVLIVARAAVEKLWGKPRKGKR